MATIDERIATLEARLKAEKEKKQKLESRQKAAENKRKRAEDTRKKILIGSAVLHEVMLNPTYEAKILKLVDGYLTRDDDRALFGLPSLTPPQDTETAHAPEPVQQQIPN